MTILNYNMELRDGQGAPLENVIVANERLTDAIRDVESYAKQKYRPEGLHISVTVESYLESSEMRKAA